MTKVTIKKEDNLQKKPFEVKPLVEAQVKGPADTGEDVYCVQGVTKKQFGAHVSPIYGTKEYFLKTKFVPGEQIIFCHNDTRIIPAANQTNSGFTLVGKAKDAFQAKRALSAKGEESDDQEYVYFNEHSLMYYVGDEQEHTLFMRIYDNQNGCDNDRWVVLYLD